MFSWSQNAGQSVSSTSVVYEKISRCNWRCCRIAGIEYLGLISLNFAFSAQLCIFSAIKNYSILQILINNKTFIHFFRPNTHIRYFLHFREEKFMTAKLDLPFEHVYICVIIKRTLWPSPLKTAKTQDIYTSYSKLMENL